MSKTAQPILPVGASPTSDTFTVESQSAHVGFLKRAVQPPSHVYIESSDVLTVSVATSGINEVVTVNYRLLRFDGVLIHGQFTITPTALYTTTFHSEQLAEGFLMSMSCKAFQADRRGITFVRAYLTKPSLGVDQPSYMLMADYVTRFMAPTYHNGRVLAPTEGPGVIYPFNLSPPAPGTDFNINMPGNAQWRIMSVTARLQTSATVGNRTPTFLFWNGVQPAASVDVSQAVPASTPFLYTLGPGLPVVNGIANDSLLPLPSNFFMGINQRISSATQGIQPGDQWSLISAWVEEWLDSV